MAAVVGECRHGIAEASVAGPPEGDREVLARAPGDRRHPRQGGHRFRSVVRFPTVAPLGEHLGGADLPGSWQRAEDHGVRVLVEMGDDRAVKVLDRAVERPDDPDHGQHSVAPGLQFGSVREARRRRPEPLEELDRSAPPAVAVLAQERRHPTLAEVGGRGRRGIALEEGEGDFAPHIGEQLAGTGPRCGEDRGQLVAGGDPCVDQVRSRPDGCPEGSRLGAERPKSAQIVVTQAQVVGDHLGVTRIALGARADLGLAPRLDRRRLDRHDRMTGVEEPVDESSVRPLDGDGQLGRVAVPHEPADEALEAVGRMADREPLGNPTGIVDDADGMLIRRPVDPRKHRSSLVWQHDLGDEDLSRAVTDWRSAARPSVAGRTSRGTGGGGVIVAREGQPTQAVSPILTERQHSCE